MSEDITAATEQPIADTPENGTGNEQATPEVDWQERYTNLQPEYTRATQEAAQLRQMVEALRDPDSAAHRQFLTELGYALEDDTPDLDENGDPIAAIAQKFDQRFSEIEQRFAQQDTQAQVARGEAAFEKACADIASKRGFALSEEEQDMVFGMAVAGQIPPTKDGLPDFEAAYQRLDKGWDYRQQHWAQTKQTPHRVSPAGGAGNETPDLDDRDQRIAWMAERFASGAQS